MIKAFSSNQSYVLFFIPFIVLLHFGLNHFFPIFDITIFEQNNLWRLDFVLLPSFLSKFLAFIFICLNAFVINSFFNALDLLNRNTFLPSIIYVLLISLFPFSIFFNEILVGQLFISLSFFSLLFIRQNEDVRNRLFFSGFFLGITITFLPFYFFFILIIWFGISNIRSFSLREYILPIAGMIVPILWLFLIEPKWYLLLLHFNTKNITFDYIHFDALLILSITFILVAMAFSTVLRTRLKNSLHFKKISLIILLTIFVYSTISLFFFFFYHTYFYLAVTCCFLPLLLPYPFLQSRIKWIPNILFYILLIYNVIKFIY